jgi:hypothetical protein
MYSPFRLSKVCFIVIGLVLVLFVAGCEFYQEITFDNQTPFPIQVDIKSVPLDYQGTPEFNFPPGDVIQAGESKKFVTPVQDSRTVGAERKYPVVAVAETGEVVFLRVFTWDELHDMGWKVEIVTQKQE